MLSDHSILVFLHVFLLKLLIPEPVAESSRKQLVDQENISMAQFSGAVQTKINKSFPQVQGCRKGGVDLYYKQKGVALSSDPLLLQMQEWTAPFPVLLHLLYEELMSEWCDLTHLCPSFSCLPLIPSILCSLSHLFPSFYPSLEGEESRRFIKASVWGSGQEKASLPAFVPSHPRSLASRPGRRGNRSRPASAPPSPSRPLRFLPHGVAGASRLLSHRERHVRGHRAGAFAQEIGFSGHQFPQVSPGNTDWQRVDGPPAWAQTLVQREVSTSHPFTGCCSVTFDPADLCVRAKRASFVPPPPSITLMTSLTSVRFEQFQLKAGRLSHCRDSLSQLKAQSLLLN